jgi:hypothetical protein
MFCVYPVMFHPVMFCVYPVMFRVYLCFMWSESYISFTQPKLDRAEDAGLLENEYNLSANTPRKNNTPADNFSNTGEYRARLLVTCLCYVIFI